MLSRKFAKLTIATFMALGTIPMLQMTVKSAPGLTPTPVDPAIKIPCCRCIGNEGSGVSLNTGSGAGTVPYRVTGPGITNQTAVPITSNLHPAWTASLPPAGWVQPNTSNGGTNHPAGLYTYSIRITVPKCTIPMQAILSGSAAGDDQIVVKLDGVPIGATAGPGWGFQAGKIVSFSTILSGTHTLSIEVTNHSLTPHGVIVKAGIRTICGKDLEIPIVKPPKES
jgi:hypothetical protein